MSTLLAEVGPTVIEAVNPNNGNSIPPWLAIILAIVIIGVGLVSILRRKR